MTPLSDIKKILESRKKYWIAFTGDSITSTEWVHPNWREIVEYVIKNKLDKEFENWKIPDWGIRCFNFAYDGATTKDILEKVDDILSVKPSLVIGLMGGNDPTFKIPVLEHVANIIAISSRLNAQGVSVVWCNSTPAGNGSKKNKEYEPYAGATLQIPRDDLQLIDMYNIYKQFPMDKFFTFASEENPIEGIKEGEPDLQHPNPLGNAYIAKVILKEVFGVEFDPEKYIEDTNKGEKFPKY